jgi:RNA polymerase sigma factor (sigma-70 family)
MRSKHKEEWNKFLTRHYSKLLRIGKRWTTDSGDLVHHVYLRCCDKDFPENPLGYFVKAMYNEATRGKFKQLYTIHDNDFKEISTENDLTKAIQREQLQLVLDRLSWFDRTVFRLYLQGWNMADVSRRSGIGESTLYRSLHVTRKTLKDVFRNRTETD